MSTEISDNNHNDKRGLTDLEWANELYIYLQNKPLPQEANITNLSNINLNEDQAFKVIWFLQEHLRVIPDNIERCECCGDLYDTHSEGEYVEESFNGMFFFCGSCQDQIPDEHYDTL